MFQPRNRNIKDLILMPGTSSMSTHPRLEWLNGDWYVDDIDSNGEPTAWAAENCANRVQQDRDGFIVCTDRGMWLRHPAQRNGRKGRIMRFKSHVDAAIAAEAHNSMATHTSERDA